MTKAPITRLLEQVPAFKGFDPFFIVFADSAHADADQCRSTACDIQVLQGGLIDHMSWVLNPIPQSTAESENNCYSAAIMRVLYTMTAVSQLWFQQENVLYTVPICVDSTAAIAMNESDNIT